jgi:transposase-like protein
MKECPYCQSKQKQVKAGKNESGSQRWQCQQCGRKYTPEPKAHGYPDVLRQQAVKMSVDGINYRRIGRLLGVDHKTVMHWVKAYTDQLPEASLPPDVHNAEQDELFTFVGRKKTWSM